jgi:hypothetical protein
MSAHIEQQTTPTIAPTIFDDAENPIITCPVCEFTAPLLDGFTVRADELLDCGNCGSQID